MPSTPTGTAKVALNGDNSLLPPATLTDNGDGTSSGTTVFTPASPGNYSLQGRYQGDAAHNPSQSTSQNEEADSAVSDTVTSITPTPNPVIAGQPVTIKVTVANAS